MIASTDQLAPDPDLLTLVPRRSPGRTLALVIGALALVALAAVSPQLRPALVAPNSHGGAQALLPSGDVMSALVLEPRRFMTQGIAEVADVTGAQLIDAWIAVGPMGDATGSTDAATFMARAFPDDVTPLPADLPATAFDVDDAGTPTGETWLVLQWRPAGCVRVQPDGPSPTGEVGPVATVRGPLGIPIKETLPDLAGPVLIGPVDTPSAVPMCEQPTP